MSESKGILEKPLGYLVFTAGAGIIVMLIEPARDRILGLLSVRIWLWAFLSIELLQVFVGAIFFFRFRGRIKQLELELEEAKTKKGTPPQSSPPRSRRGGGSGSNFATHWKGHDGI